MYQRYKERFGTAGVVLGVIALILALGGSALAASGKLTPKQKKEVEKIAKKYAGKDGAPGSPGTPGANGTNGTNGAKGDPGEKGDAGTDGTAGDDGAPGKSVSVTAADEFHCNDLGGALVEVEDEPSTAQEVCTGEQGPPGVKGDTGDPWTAGGKLPPGATETGSWAFTGTEADTRILVPLSFSVPLKSDFELDERYVHYQGDPGFSTSCPLPGSVTEPHAKPGELCVYFATAPAHATFQLISKPDFIGEPGAFPAGAVLVFSFSGSAGQLAQGSGTWAVTGCSQSLPSGDPNLCPTE